MFARLLKKRLHILVLVALMLCLVPARAKAAATPKPDDDPIAGYIEQRFDAGLEANAAPRLRARPTNGLTGNDSTVYWALKGMISGVAAGERTSTVFEIPVDTFCYPTYFNAQQLGLETVVENGQITDQAAQALYEKIDFDLDAVMNALLTDCIYELYWFDKTYDMGVDYPLLWMSDESGEWVVGFDPDDVLTIAFPVSADYSVDGTTGTYQVDPSTGQRVSTAVETAAAVAAGGADLSAYDRLAYFKDWICEAVGYNFTAAGGDSVPYGDPWQLVYVFDGDDTTDVVCEGYAKAFQYLCDLAGIADVDCYTVTGTMDGGTGAGPHMWNLVNMDDGRVYLVDVTNCDEDSAGYPDLLFVAEYLQVAGDGAYYVGPENDPLYYGYDSDTLSVYAADELALSDLPYTGVDDPTSGAWGTCPWEIDDAGNLYVYPGTGASQSAKYESPWDSLKDTIRSVTFVARDGQKVIAPKNCDHLFASLSECESYDLSGLDTSNVTSMRCLFDGNAALTTLDLSGLDTHNVTDMSSMFIYCGALTGIDMSGWDTSSLQSAQYMFYFCESLTSLDVSAWDTSSLVNAQAMFGVCEKLTALDVSGWDTSHITDMFMMFTYCSSLKTLDVSGWDVSSVENFQATFNTCAALTSLDVSDWDTSSATNMCSMFLDCPSLTRLDVSGFDVSHVANFASMFASCTKVEALDVSGWDTSSATNMMGMFCACVSLTELDVSNFDVSHVVSFADMFSSCERLSGLDLSRWDTPSLEDISGMFSGCESFVALDLSSFDTSHMVDMGGFVSRCPSLVSLDLSGFDTHLITDMSGMFSGCPSLRSLDLSSFDTSSVTDMSTMFCGCQSLEQVILSGFDTGSVTTMKYMFDGCVSLKTLDLSGFSNTDVTDMSYMIRDCVSLTEVDLTDFGTANVREMFHMFSGCSSLTTLDLSSFDTRAASDMGGFFDGLTSLVSYTVGANFVQPEENGYWSYPSGQWMAASDGQVYEWYDLAHRVCADTYTLYIEPHYERIEDASIIIEDSILEWTGEALEPAVRVVNWDGTVLVEGVDYTLAYFDNVEPGEAGVTATGIGSFQGEESATFTIVRPSLVASDIADIKDQTFTGSAITPGVVVTHNGRTLIENVDYTVTYDLNVDAGTAMAVVLPQGHYDGGYLFKDFTILPASLEGATVSAIADQTYTGSGITPKPTVKLGKKTLVWGADYSLSYTNNVKVGTATVTIKGENNYTGKLSVTFSIVEPPAPTHAPGWAKEDGTYYYYGDDGKPMCDHWESYGGVWYYFGADGKLVWNGWSYYRGVRYYMGSNGRLTGSTWASVDGKYYYIGSDYRPVTNGWAVYGGKYYYLDGNGNPQQSGWVVYGGKYYYLRSYNPVVNTWIEYQGVWYHFNGSAACDRSWTG